jgi:hypothetical protein
MHVEGLKETTKRLKSEHLAFKPGFEIRASQIGRMNHGFSVFRFICEETGVNKMRQIRIKIFSNTIQILRTGKKRISNLYCKMLAVLITYI